jgi:excinuclease UvrABC nuclease subunit
MKTYKWQSTKFTYGNTEVPENPGVYLINRVHRIGGVPLKSEPIYIGRTNNLRRRLCSTFRSVEAT